MNLRKVMARAIKNKDPKPLVSHLFNLDITEGQADIIKAIIFDSDRKICISAYTRYGKTRTLAISILLYILFNKDKSISIIAPYRDQSAKMREYISEMIPNSKKLTNLVQTQATGIERLKKEVSKKRITFKNGCDIRVLTAHGEAKRLMGEGADFLILDESCLIDYEVFRSKISRMRGDDYKGSMIVQVGNPWDRLNQFYEAWKDPDYLNIHIDDEQGIKEGRHSKKFFKEQKDLLTNKEYKVLYKAKFPQSSKDSLINYNHIENAINNNIKLDNTKTVYGLDIAEKGNDLTILTKAKKEGNRYKVTNIEELNDNETMDVVNEVSMKIDKDDKIYIDTIGFGAGVESRLKQMGYNTISVRVSQKPDREKDRFLNKKSQLYDRLRGLFEDGYIDIPVNDRLKNQLVEIKYDFTSRGKLKIVDPDKGSPDYADSLMLCTAHIKRKKGGIGTIDIS